MLKIIIYVFVSIVSVFLFFFFICILQISMTFWSCKLVLISSNVLKESSWLFITFLHVFTTAHWPNE